MKWSKFISVILLLCASQLALFCSTKYWPVQSSGSYSVKVSADSHFKTQILRNAGDDFLKVEGEQASFSFFSDGESASNWGRSSQVRHEEKSERTTWKNESETMNALEEVEAPNEEKFEMDPKSFKDVKKLSEDAKNSVYTKSDAHENEKRRDVEKADQTLDKNAGNNGDVSGNLNHSKQQSKTLKSDDDDDDDDDDNNGKEKSDGVTIKETDDVKSRQTGDSKIKKHDAVDEETRNSRNGVATSEKSINSFDKNLKSYVNLDLRPQCKYHEGRWIRINDLQKLHKNEIESSIHAKTNIIYDGKNCSFLSSNWDCIRHKRPSYDYLNYKWVPFDCHLPDFDPVDFLTRMQNKVVAFLGDSIGQQNFQSLLCLLSTSRLGVEWEDAAEMFGFYLPKGERKPTGWAYRFTKTNTTVALAWNSVLCKQEKYYDTELSMPRVAMHLDRPDPFLTNNFHRLDVIILNTGSHWNRGKMKKNGWLFFLNGEKVKPKGRKHMTIGTAINITISSISSFLQHKLDEAKESRERGEERKIPLIFFRTLAARHFMNGDWNTGGGCDDMNHVMDEKEIEGRPQRDMVVEDAVQNTDIILLNVTHLTQYRGDSHPAGWARKGTQDCLHWCMPGVPDVWNQIVYYHILFSEDSKATTDLSI